MGFGGFDFSDYVNNHGGEAQPGGGTGAFRDIFSQFFGNRRGEQPAPPDQKKAPTLNTAWTSTFGKLSAARKCVSMSRARKFARPAMAAGTVGGTSTVCPECDGTGNVTQMAGAMKFSLTCPRCDGKGRLRNVCPTCHGDGRLSKSEVVEVRIPPGAQSGSRLRVAGKGNAGRMSGGSGDLYITVRVEPHAFFRRDGDDIHIQVPVTVSEAGLGAKIEVPTIDGRALLKVPQGTQNQQKFRLREKGVMNARKNQRGDEIVEVVIQAPKAQDERTRELLRELSQANTEDPRKDIWSKV